MSYKDPLVDKYNLEPEVYKEIYARGESIVECAGCHKVLLASRNVRKASYCVNCENKVSRLDRYSNAGYSPNEKETEAIFSDTSRAGNA